MSPKYMILTILWTTFFIVLVELGDHYLGWYVFKLIHEQLSH